MKQVILIFVIVFYAMNAFGQSNDANKKVKSHNVILKINKVKDNNLSRIINEFELLKEFNSGNLFIRIIKVNNGAGSAGGDSGEVNYNLYIGVSEPGELYRGNLFYIENLYMPKIEKIDTTNSENPLVIISYITNYKRTKIKLKISIDDVKLDRE